MILMAKRVGITHVPEERKEQWRRKYPSLHNWKIRESGLSYEQAQQKENEWIARGYEGSPGGEKEPGYIYSVYTFEY